MNFISAQLKTNYDNSKIPNINIPSPVTIGINSSGTINNYYNITNTTINNYNTDYANIALINQSDTWTNGENITMGVGGWFKGAFNWIVSALTGSSFATFNGTDLWINTTYFYNQTQSPYFYNMTQSAYFYNMTVLSAGNSANIFNQWLNTTSNVTFYNISVTQDVLINGVGVSQWLYNQTQSTYFYNMTTGAIDISNTKYLNLSGTNANQAIDFLNNNFTVNGTTFFVNAGNGRVGIGTTSPTHTLNVVGKTNITGNAIYQNNITLIGNNANSQNQLILAESNSTDGAGFYNSSRLVFDASGNDAGGNPYDVKWHIFSAQYAGIANRLIFGVYNNGGAFTPQLTISNLGGVGIGTTQPAHALDVIGTINVTGISVFDSKVGIGTGLTPVYLLQTGVSPIGVNLSGVLYVNGTTGKVGIGTVTPSQKLEVVGNVNISAGGNMTIGAMSLNCDVISCMIKVT